MKTIFEGEIVEVLTMQGGVVISYVLERSDNQIKIAYKMLSLNDGNLSSVASSVYKLAKFGSNYRAFETRTDDVFGSKVIVLQNGREFILEKNGRAKILDTDATPLWEGVLSFEKTFPSDVAVCGGLWAVYPEKNVLVRYNSVTMREELRIGGDKSEMFDKPVSIFTVGNSCYVANKNGQNVVKVDAESFDVEVCEQFDKPVYKYLNADGYQFVQFDTGLYQL